MDMECNEKWLKDGYSNREPNMKDLMAMNGCFSFVMWAAMFALAMALCSLFGSCSKTTTVDVVRAVKTDTILVARWSVDTLKIQDTVYVESKGDTVRIIEKHWYRKVSNKKDTVYVSRTDSVPVPYPVEVEKEVKVVPVYMKIVCWVMSVLICVLLILLTKSEWINLLKRIIKI